MQGDAALTVPVVMALLAVLSFDATLAQLLCFSHELEKCLIILFYIIVLHCNGFILPDIY